MIRKAKMKQKFYYRYSVLGNIICFSRKFKEWQAFTNDENLLHNDVGPAFCDRNISNSWYWNGIFIK